MCLRPNLLLPCCGCGSCALVFLPCLLSSGLSPVARERLTSSRAGGARGWLSPSWWHEAERLNLGGKEVKMSADVCRTRACRGVFVSDRSHACLGLHSVRSSDRLRCCCPPTKIGCRMIQKYHVQWCHANTGCLWWSTTPADVVDPTKYSSVLKNVRITDLRRTAKYFSKHYQCSSSRVSVLKSQRTIRTPVQKNYLRSGFDRSAFDGMRHNLLRRLRSVDHQGH